MKNTMKKHLSILLYILLTLSLIGCGAPAPNTQALETETSALAGTSTADESTSGESTSNGDSTAPETPSQDFFNAVVLDYDLYTVLAECTACESGAIPVGSEIFISTNTISSEEVPFLIIGDRIRVVYIGDIQETEPLQLQDVISIFRIKENGEINTEPAKNCIENLDNPNWGITLTAENVTPTELTISCSQAGGEPTGELQTGSYFVLEKSVNDTWEKVEYLPLEYDVSWTAEAWLIPPEETMNWYVKWEWLYGALPAGQYRIGKEIMDFRGPGNYDTAMHYAEFTID